MRGNPGSDAGQSSEPRRLDSSDRAPEAEQCQRGACAPSWSARFRRCLLWFALALVAFLLRGAA